jgi:outer membrane protein assembly factor BamB/tetratricopeptide (TPR) repeat protein
MTLSANGERLYARLGESGNSMAFGNQFNNSNSIIAAFDIKNKGQLIWRVAGSSIPLKQPDGEKAPELGSVEGTPVADAERVYVVLTLPGVQTSTYVAALSAANGSVLWTRYLFDIPNPFDMQAAAQGAVPGHAHHLLTMANGALYYQSDSGGVVSLEAETGHVRWTTAYPRRDPTSTPLTRRDLNPVVYDNGTIYVAPSDSLHIYAMNADNGGLKWISAPLPDVVHLVGVAQGNVMATGDRVWTIDSSSGKILRSWPDSGVGYPAAGRGLLAGNLLYWPTENEIHVIDAKTGLRSQKGSINLRDFQSQGGNLALGDGFLVIASVDSLSVFTQNSRLIKRYQHLIAQNPESSLAHYRLATAAENLGEAKLAIDAYREAVKRVRPVDRLDGQPMERLIRERFYHLLVRQASSEKDAELALNLLREAASESSDPLKKLAARMTIATLQMERGDAPGSFQELATIARDPVASTEFWQPQGNYHVNLAAQARARLVDAWQKIPATGKAAIEQQNLTEIKALAGKQNKNIQGMVDFLRGVPPGPAEATGWLSILSQLDSAQSADVIRRLEKLPGLSDDLSKAIASARAEHERVNQEKSADQPISALPKTLWLNESGSPGQAWLIAEINEQPIADRLFRKTALLRTVADGTVDVIRMDDNATLANLGAEIHKPLWAGMVNGRGLVFDGLKLAGFDPITGKLAWTLSLSEQSPDSSFQSPFAKPGNRQAQESEPPARRHAPEDDWWMIQASGDRLILQSVQGDCWRIDPVFGRLLWHRRTEPGDGATAILLGRHVLMRDGSAVILLNADSGVMERSIDGSIAGTQWIRRPIAWDDDRVLMTADRMQVIMLDLKTGKKLWQWQATEIQPTNGPPRYFRRGDSLVGISDGKLVVRIDPKTGQILWQKMLGSADHSLEFRDVAIDDQFVYFVQQLDPKSVPGAFISAYHLTDGSPAWSRRLVGSSISWAIESVKTSGQNRLWLFPDCEASRRLVSGQAMSVLPADLGENQGNATSDIPASVVELDPATGRMIRRIVSRVSDSANWVMPDWASGRLLWVSAKGTRQMLMDLSDDDGQKPAPLSPR